MNSRRVPAAGRGQLPKFQSPKMWRRRQKLHANPLSLFARFSLIHHPALLVFQRFRVRQDEHLAVINLVFQEEQTAMRVHHHGFASLLELLSAVRAAVGLHAHLMKRPPAAPVCWRRCSAHTAIIERFRKQRPLALGTGVPHKQPLQQQRKFCCPSRPPVRS